MIFSRAILLSFLLIFGHVRQLVLVDRDGAARVKCRQLNTVNRLVTLSFCLVVVLGDGPVERAVRCGDGIDRNQRRRKKNQRNSWTLLLNCRIIQKIYELLNFLTPY